MNDAGNSLRNALRAEREALFAEFYRNGRVAPLLRALARTVDRLLRRVVVDANLKDRILLVAVGGYGRGELFPYSDVDVLIIPCQALTSADEQAVETLVGLLWDLGLHLGHS
ncbi:MAG: nucleotidyltransferase domain-containing protein, partial [Betaproteobacteria bacterium]